MVWICPECEARNPVKAVSCWVCDGPLRPGPGKPEPLPELDPAPPPSSTFRLSSLMIAIALIAMVLGVVRESPGLAILLAIAAVPALAFTFSTSLRRRSEGVPMTTAQKIGTFLGAVAVTVSIIVIVLVVLVVSFIAALYVICSGACN